MNIKILSGSVVFNDTEFIKAPLLISFTEILDCDPRIYRSIGLPMAIFDACGVAVRFFEVTSKVHSLLVYFATSRRECEPIAAFSGDVTLNGLQIRRPVKLKDVRLEGEFRFDQRPQPVSIQNGISVRLVPKFEYLGSIDIGWEDAGD
jgi:hypothetical protein